MRTVDSRCLEEKRGVCGTSETAPWDIEAMDGDGVW